MDAKSRATVPNTYEDFEPSTEWVREEGSDTLLVYLPGFKKEQLKIQITPSRNVKISGERLLEDNKWSRFRKEFRVPTNCDINGLSAKLEGGILFVKQPKLITPAEQAKGKPIIETPKPQKPANEPRSQKNEQEHATKGVTSMAGPDKRSNEKANEVANANDVSQKAVEKKKEPRDTNGKSGVPMNAKNGQEHATQGVTSTTGPDKRSNEKANELANANDVSQKVVEKKKEPRDTNGKSGVPMDAKNGQEHATQGVTSMAGPDKRSNANDVSQKALEKKKEPRETSGKSGVPMDAKNGQEHATQGVTSMAGLDKRSNGKANEVANANDVSQKALEKEKEPRDTNEKSSLLMDAKNVPKNTIENEKTDANNISDAGKVTSKTSEKHEDRSDSTDDDTETETEETGNVNGSGKCGLMKKVVGGSVMEQPMRRHLMNLVVAVLLALLLGLYVTNTFRSSGKSKM